MNLSYSHINFMNLLNHYNLQRKCIYFLLQETMLFQRNINDVTEKMLQRQSFPKEKGTEGVIEEEQNTVTHFCVIDALTITTWKNAFRRLISHLSPSFFRFLTTLISV